MTACRRCKRDVLDGEENCAQCEINAARSAATSTPLVVLYSISAFGIIVVGIHLVQNFRPNIKTISKPAAITVPSPAIAPSPPPDTIFETPSNGLVNEVVAEVTPPPSPQQTVETGGASSSTSISNVPKLENVIQDFLDSGVFTRASFDGGVARVKIPTEFRTLNDNIQEACLDALWDYYYEDGSGSTRLIIQDAKTLSGLGYYSQKDGLFWTTQKTEPVKATAVKRPFTQNTDVALSSSSRLSAQGSLYGSKSKYLSGSGKTQHVSGYVTKSGKVVSSYMRHSSR